MILWLNSQIRRRQLVLRVLIWLLAATSVQADWIILRDGNVFECLIVKETDRFVVARVDGAKKSFSLGKIAAIKSATFEAHAIGEPLDESTGPGGIFECSRFTLNGRVVRGGEPNSKHAGDLTRVAVEIELETDLPDDTQLLGSVTRAFTVTLLDMGAKKTDIWSEDYAKLDLKVKDLQRPHVILIDRKRWVEAFKLTHKQLSIGSDGATVDAVDQNIGIWVAVSPRQTSDRFGEYNGGLFGDVVSAGLLGRTVGCTLYLPNQESIDGRQLPKYRHGYALEVGKKYRISKVVPLMGTSDPDDWIDIALAIATAGDVPANSTIEITAKAMHDHLPWYRVIVHDKAGRRVGTGWVYSGALLGEQVVEVD